MATSAAHIPFVTLADIAEQRSLPDEPMRQHLATCPRCAADLAWLERTMGLMRSDRAELPPAHVTARAKRLFRPAARPQPPSLRQRLVGLLQFDSTSAPLAAGVRAGAAQQRLLLFRADRYTIDLRVLTQGGGLSVIGQVLGANTSGHVEIAGPNTAARANLNQTSGFALPPVQPGAYTLTLVLSNLDITIPDLEIG